MPVGVQRNENNATTFKPYDPLEVLGKGDTFSPEQGYVGNNSPLLKLRRLTTTAPVYNFEVDGWHTYHVGKLGVWVHNADCSEWATNSTNHWWKSKIEGRGQATGTDGHAFRSYREAVRLAKNPNIERVTLDLGYNRALGLAPRTIRSNRRPDVIGVFGNGRVARVEVQSRTDVPAWLRLRNVQLNGQLHRQGFSPLRPDVVKPTRTK